MADGHKPKRNRSHEAASRGKSRAGEERPDGAYNDLRSNESLFRSLVETAGDWVWAVDENAVYTYASPRSLDLIGYEPSEVVGRTPFDFMPPEEAKRVRDIFIPVAQKREPIVLFENTLLRKDGLLIIVETSGMPVFDSDGVFRGYRGTDRDVTDRKRAEEELQESREKYRQLVEGVTDVIWESDAALHFTYLNQRVKDMLGFEPEELIGRSPFELMLPEVARDIGERIVLMVERGVPIESMRLSMLRADGITAFLEATATSILDENGDIAGYRGTARDISQRLRAEKEAQESQEKYRRLVEDIVDCLWEIDENAVFTFMGPQSERILGYSPDEMVGLHPYDFMEKADAEQLSRYVQSIIETASPMLTHPIKMIHKDGRTITVQLNGKPIRDEDGHVIGHRGTARDVTDLVHAEEELFESREKYRLLVEEIEDCLWELDEDMVITYMSPAIKRLIGYTPEEVVGHRPYDFMEEADAEQLSQYMRSIFETAAPMSMHLINILDRDGRKVVVQLNAKPILDEHGRAIGYRGIARNVTDLVRAEEELRESREKFRRLVEETNDCLWELGEDAVYTYLSPQTERLLGYKPEEMVGRSPYDFMSETDASQLRSRMEAIAVRGAPIPMVPMTMHGKDGQAVVFQISGAPIVDDKGRFHGYRGIARDITEQSRAQAALRESQEMYRGLVEDIDDIVWEVDENLCYTYISPRVADSMGYSPEELIGVHALERFSPGEAERILHAVGRREVMERAKFRHLRKDGTIAVLEVSSRPMFDAEGQYIGYRGITRDVTKQVLAQDALRESEDRYRRLVEDIDDVVWEVDTNFCYTYVSPRACDVLGYPPEDLVGHSILELIPQEDIERITGELMPIAAQHGTLDRAQVRLPYKSGGIAILEISARPVFDGEGNYVGYRGISRDVTRQVHYQQRLAKLNECVLSFGPDARQNIQRLTDLVGKLLDADVTLYNRLEDGKLKSWAKYNAPAGFELDDQPESYVCNDVISAQQDDLLVIRDLPGTPHAERLPIKDDLGWKTYVGKSVKLAEEHVGSLCCLYRRDYVPDEDDTRLLGIIASAIGIEDNRYQALLALRHNEKFLEDVFDGIQDGISVLDKDLRVIRVNRTMEQWLNASSSHIVGQRCYEAYHHRNEPCPGCPTLRAMEQKTLQMEVMRQEDSRGRPAWIELFSHPLLDENGEVWGVVEYVRDVTARVIAQEEVERLSRRNELILATAGEGILGVDAIGNVTFINPAGAMMLGYEPEELAGMPAHETVHHTKPSGAPRPRSECPNDLALQDGQTHFTLDDVYWRKDGASIPVDCVTAPIWENGVLVGAVTVFKDISERKLAEEQRRAFERQIEAQKRHFYRETILSVTDGKLDICEQTEIRPYVAGSALRIDVREASAVSVARHEIEAYCLEHGASPSRLDAFMIGVGEAITNALKHAKWGRVYAGVDNGTAWVAVADRGDGISSLILPKATLFRGYSTKPSLGLGYTIMLEVSDRILLKTGERGTTVVLVHELLDSARNSGTDHIKDTWEAIPT